MTRLHCNYGGTFDPIHCGHLEVARSAAEQLGDVVHLVPAGDPAHRDAPRVSAEQRAQMVALAIAGDARLALDRREVRRGHSSYTVDTLRELRGELGDAHPIAVLVGVDAVRGLTTWREWRALFDLGHLVALTRPGHDLANLDTKLATELDGRRTTSVADLRLSAAGRVLALAVPEWPVSSTQVRAALARGESVDEWVPTPVAGYVREHGLYRD